MHIICHHAAFDFLQIYESLDLRFEREIILNWNHPVNHDMSVVELYENSLLAFLMIKIGLLTFIKRWSYFTVKCSLVKRNAQVEG